MEREDSGTSTSTHWNAIGRPTTNELLYIRRVAASPARRPTLRRPSYPSPITRNCHVLQSTTAGAAGVANARLNRYDPHRAPRAAHPAVATMTTAADAGHNHNVSDEQRVMRSAEPVLTARRRAATGARWWETQSRIVTGKHRGPAGPAHRVAKWCKLIGKSTPHPSSRDRSNRDAPSTCRLTGRKWQRHAMTIRTADGLVRLRLLRGTIELPSVLFNCLFTLCVAVGKSSSTLLQVAGGSRSVRVAGGVTGMGSADDVDTAYPPFPTDPGSALSFTRAHGRNLLHVTAAAVAVMVEWATAVAHTTITDAVDGSVVSVRGKPPRFRTDARVAALTDGDMVAWRESETVLASAE